MVCSCYALTKLYSSNCLTTKEIELLLKHQYWARDIAQELRELLDVLLTLVQSLTPCVLQTLMLALSNSSSLGPSTELPVWLIKIPKKRSLTSCALLGKPNKKQ